jgi:hypothetical protein
MKSLRRQGSQPPLPQNIPLLPAGSGPAVDMLDDLADGTIGKGTPGADAPTAL